MRKKLTPHHRLTPKGGRVATRTREKIIYRVTSRCQAAADALPLFFFPNIRRTRQRSW